MSESGLANGSARPAGPHTQGVKAEARTLAAVRTLAAMLTMALAVLIGQGCTAIDAATTDALAAGWDQIRPLADSGVTARTDAGIITPEEAAAYRVTIDGHGRIIDALKEPTHGP